MTVTCQLNVVKRTWSLFLFDEQYLGTNWLQIVTHFSVTKTQYITQRQTLATVGQHCFLIQDILQSSSYVDSSYNIICKALALPRLDVGALRSNARRGRIF